MLYIGHVILLSTVIAQLYIARCMLHAVSGLLLTRVSRTTLSLKCVSLRQPFRVRRKRRYVPLELCLRGEAERSFSIWSPRGKFQRVSPRAFVFHPLSPFNYFLFESPIAPRARAIVRLPPPLREREERFLKRASSHDDRETPVKRRIAQITGVN